MPAAEAGDEGLGAGVATACLVPGPAAVEGAGRHGAASASSGSAAAATAADGEYAGHARAVDGHDGWGIRHACVSVKRRHRGAKAFQDEYQTARAFLFLCSISYLRGVSFAREKARAAQQAFFCSDVVLYGDGDDGTSTPVALAHICVCVWSLCHHHLLSREKRGTKCPCMSSILLLLLLLLLERGGGLRRLEGVLYVRYCAVHSHPNATLHTDRQIE